MAARPPEHIRAVRSPYGAAIDGRVAGSLHDMRCYAGLTLIGKELRRIRGAFLIEAHDREIIQGRRCAPREFIAAQTEIA